MLLKLKIICFWLILSAASVGYAINKEGSTTESFVPFIAKDILIAFDGHTGDLSKIKQKYMGKKISYNLVKQIEASITESFVINGYFPPQITIDKVAMSASILKFDIKVRTITKVTILGDAKDNALIREYTDNIISTDSAKTLNLQKYLGLIKKIPGIKIQYRLVTDKNDEDSCTLIIHATKNKGLVTAGADNTGLDNLGKYQATVFAQVFTPFADGDSIALNGATTDHPDRFSDVGASYNYILNSHGTAAHLKVDHNENNGSNNQSVTTPNGKSNSVGLSLSQQLLLRADQDLSIEVGTDYLTSEQYQVNNNISQKYTVQKYWSSEIGLNYLFQDRLDGRNLFQSNFTYGLNGTYENYIDQPPNLPNQHFNNTILNYYRDQPIAVGFSAFLHLTIHNSADNLPIDEQAYFGGNDFGRGYDFATLQGTKMRAGLLELRYTKELDEFYIHEIQPYLYGDAGYVNQIYANTNVSQLESLGAGIRFKLANKINLSMEVAHPCTRNIVIDNTYVKSTTRLNMFISKVFEF